MARAVPTPRPSMASRAANANSSRVLGRDRRRHRLLPSPTPARAVPPQRRPARRLTGRASDVAPGQRHPGPTRTPPSSTGAGLGLAGHSLGASGVSMRPGHGPVGGQHSPATTTNPGRRHRRAGTACPAASSLGCRPWASPVEYGLFNVPNDRSPPAIRCRTWAGSTRWDSTPACRCAQFTIQGSTHYEWSLIPTTPVRRQLLGSTSWVDWGRPMAEHYSVAWMDRWLKTDGETGLRHRRCPPPRRRSPSAAQVQLLLPLVPCVSSAVGNVTVPPTTSDVRVPRRQRRARAPPPVRAPRPRWRLAWTPSPPPRPCSHRGPRPGSPGSLALLAVWRYGAGRRPALRRSGSAGTVDAHHDVASNPSEVGGRNACDDDRDGRAGRSGPGRRPSSPSTSWSAGPTPTRTPWRIASAATRRMRETWCRTPTCGPTRA